MNKFKRIFIWGHKNNGHTHGYIHYGYHKAFQHMGFETYWVDDIKTMPDEFYDDSLFITEGQVDKNIPLRKNSTYILHHCNNKKYEEVGCRILNLGNYLKYCEEGISPNHKENKVQKIKDLCFYDNVSLTLYQTWATDLLPEEIKTEDACPYDTNKNSVHFIGCRWHENEKPIQEFTKSCSAHNKIFSHHFRVSFLDDRNFTRNSYICPDFRGDWHIECGYIPCRIFKNLSYGKIVGINSFLVQKIFPEYVAYAENGYNLFEACEEKYRKTSLEKIQEAMVFIRDKHTYLNRIENIFNILG